MTDSTSSRSQVGPVQQQAPANILGSPMRRSRRSGHHRRAPRFNFKRQMDLEGTNYDVITSVAYLNEKYGLRKSHYIEKFIKCIHRKINVDASKISNKYVDSLDPWVKSKLFLLLVALSERGGPEYWVDKEDQRNEAAAESSPPKEETQNDETNDDKQNSSIDAKSNTKKNIPSSDSEQELKDITTVNSEATDHKDATSPDHDHVTTLTEHIIQQNINQDFSEATYDENYVFSSIWANFMEGLINHYLEKIIVPHSEMKVCQQLYKPMMKIISLYNEYNELIEKSERNGFLPTPMEPTNDTNKVESEVNGEKDSDSPDYNLTLASIHEVADKSNDLVSQERLERAQKLLWQARQDIPKTISKELTLLSEMYSTLSADEQDYELDEFVCCAEEYIESEFLPGLVNVLFANCGTFEFWKVLLVFEPFFYYIEDVGESDEEDMEDNETENNGNGGKDKKDKNQFKPDPRVITLEKICEVAAKQKWI